MSNNPSRDPLAPIEVIVSALLGLIAIAFLFTVVAKVVGPDHVEGWGSSSDRVCATGRSDAIPYVFVDSNHGNHVIGLKPGADAMERGIEVCVKHPSTAVRSGAGAGPAATGLFFIASVALTSWVIRTARKRGLFSLHVASRTRALGWFLLIGSLVAALLSAVSAGVVFAAAVRGMTWQDGLGTFDMPWTLVIVGLGVISVARVLRHAVVMQDEMDTVI